MEYEKPLVELSEPLSARRALAQLDPNFVEAKRFNRHLRATGPYCEDTRAIIDRMLMEGCRPDVQSWTQLIRAYRDAQPPQAAKAELVLAEMRAHHVAVTAQACNLVVHAWVRAGSIKRAEALVKRMEEHARSREHLVACPAQRPAPEPLAQSPSRARASPLTGGRSGRRGGSCRWRGARRRRKWRRRRRRRMRSSRMRGSASASGTRSWPRQAPTAATPRGEAPSTRSATAAPRCANRPSPHPTRLTGRGRGMRRAVM